CLSNIQPRPGRQTGNDAVYITVRVDAVSAGESSERAVPVRILIGTDIALAIERHSLQVGTAPGARIAVLAGRQVGVAQSLPLGEDPFSAVGAAVSRIGCFGGVAGCLVDIGKGAHDNKSISRSSYGVLKAQAGAYPGQKVHVVRIRKVDF